MAFAELPTWMFSPLATRAWHSLRAQAPAKLLTVVAPVGYGKTVLLSGWLAELRQAGQPCLWLSLEGRDTRAEQLLAALEQALHGPPKALHPTHALFRGPAPLALRLEALLERLKQQSTPLTLFIDQLNCCEDPRLGAVLDRLIFHSAPGLHWVLASTRSLPLDLGRALLQGWLQSIGPEALSFEHAQVAQLLGTALCERIGAPGVAQVLHATEGWPAAVRMAQIILERAEQPRQALQAFSGADESLAHLLKRQVLGGFTPELQDFLLCIAPLQSFCLDLCLHVSGQEQARAHLAELLERNVFVIALDRNRQWYRLHTLLREFLLHEAQQGLSPQRRQTVLVRAALWCERHGAWQDALDYAQASGELNTFKAMLERIAPHFVRDLGRVQPYIGWLEHLHAQGQHAQAEAEYWYAWALAFQRRYGDALWHITQLEQRLGASALAQPAGELPRRLAILKASVDSLSDRLEQAQQGAARWLASADPSADDPFNLTAAHCIQSQQFFSNFQFVQARQAVQAAQQAAFQAHSRHVDGWVYVYAALVDVYQGDYASAYPELLARLNKTRAQLGAEAGICGTLALVGAHCAVEMAKPEALALFDSGIHSLRTHGFLEAAACGLEAGVKLWQGEPGERIGIAQLQEIASSYPPRLAFMLSCFWIQRLLVLGHNAQARDEAQRIGLDPAAQTPHGLPGQNIAHLEALVARTRIELLLASGQLKPAQQLLAQQSQRAKTSHNAAHSVVLALAQADIALRNSEPALAVRHVSRAVSLAARRGIVRPFEDKAACLAAVVADTKLSAWGFASPQEQQFFAQRCRQLPLPDPTLQERLSHLEAQTPTLLAHLTTREMELLGYLDAGLSNQQIADHSELSLSTVKWHLQNLFAKLAVSRRSAALARARVLNLLAR